MILTKIEDESSLKLNYYSTCSERTKANSNYSLLGFKDNLPVLSAMEVSKVKKKVMVMVDPQSGEKFLNINGKKIKMISGEELPKTVVPANLRKVPIHCVPKKIILSSKGAHLKSTASSVNNCNNSSNVSINDEIIENNSALLDKRVVEIKDTHDKNPSLHISSEGSVCASRNTAVNSRTMILTEILNGKCPSDALKLKFGNIKEKCNTSSPVQAVNLTTNLNGNKCLSETLKLKFENIKNNKSNKSNTMEALNLTTSHGSVSKVYYMQPSNFKKITKEVASQVSPETIFGNQKYNFKKITKEVGSQISPEMVNGSRHYNLVKVTKEAAAQISPEMVDCGVQTENISSLSELDLDPLLQFIDSDFPSPSIDFRGGKNIKNSITKEQKLFHEDLKRCLDINKDGNLPIHEGVLNCDVSLVKRMCTVLAARSESINIENQNNYTPLQLAILSDSSKDIFQVLLHHRPNLDATDEEGNNIIHLAVRCERDHILGELLQHALNTNFNLNCFNFEGYTPLMVCCLNGLFECAKILLKYLTKQGINLRDQKSGRTALFHAAECHDVKMVSLLLKHDADTKIKNFFGTSAHDAMYELDDAPKEMKDLILGKSNKRKGDETPPVNPPKKKVKPKNVRVYSRQHKLVGVELTAKNTTAVCK